MSIREKLAQFCSDRFIEQDPHEELNKSKILNLLAAEGDTLFLRERSEGHFTASAMILNETMDKALMVYHNIYQSISWTGGHADGDPNLLSVAIREAKEETGVEEIYPLSSEILAVDILPVIAHQKKNKFIAAHEHFSIAYGLIAPEKQNLHINIDENSAVEWIPLTELEQRCSESHMIPIYRKLIARMKELVEKKQALYPKLSGALLPWYQKNARSLPWRNDQRPYAVWLSEIMLQQTRVEAVKEYYDRFLSQLPTLASLAAASEQELLKLWEGLGYYNRVRNLQRTAKIIMEEMQGKFPCTYEELLKLPGIGQYTAGAVASICFNQPTPAVDGNVCRVMARITEDFRNIDNPSFKEVVAARLAKYYPEQRGCTTKEQKNSMFTQSLMEIGAMICVPKGAPRCEDCPCCDFCLSHQHGTQGLLPQKRKKKARRIAEKTVFIFTLGEKIAVRKRESTGLLANLWELPNVEGILTESQAIKVASRWGVRPVAMEKMVQKTHLFSHIEWQMTGYFLRCEANDEAADETGSETDWPAEIAERGENHAPLLWVDQYQMQKQVPLPTAFKLFLIGHSIADAHLR